MKGQYLLGLKNVTKVILQKENLGDDLRRLK